MLSGVFCSVVGALIFDLQLGHGPSIPMSLDVILSFALHFGQWKVIALSRVSCMTEISFFNLTKYLNIIKD
tara:strand:- start:1032 stop:1244 length:213 start_codon:yes stop_codon:yes gene_type:complete